MKFTMKTIYLIFVMLFISFFLGMMWHKILDMELEVYKLLGYDSSNGSDDNDTFDGFFYEGERNHTAAFIKFMYWSFTTLTTVGFGDLSP